MSSNLTSVSNSPVRIESLHKKGNDVGATGDSNQHGRLVCPRCGNYTLQRDFRKTFMERVVYPWFKRYPWQCVNCDLRTILKMRAKKKRKTT